MKKILSLSIAIMFFLIPFCVFPKFKYMKVGYIDLDRIIRIYTPQYLNTEIQSVENTISRLQLSYNINYSKFSEKEKKDMQNKLQDQNSKLSSLKSNKYLWNRSSIVDDDICEKIQNNIMETIKKVAVLEGYSLIVDKTGNFIYGSEDIDLTNKVLYRLEEKLLDLLPNE